MQPYSECREKTKQYNEDHLSVIEIGSIALAISDLQQLFKKIPNLKNLRTPHVLKI